MPAAFHSLCPCRSRTRRAGVATADHSERAAVRDSLGHGPGACGVRGQLEHAHGTVPEDRSGRADDAGEPLRRRRADVQAHLIGRDGVRGHQLTRRVGCDLGGHDEIGWQLDLPRRCLPEIAHGGGELARLAQGCAGLQAVGGEEREGHGPADQDPVGRTEQVAERVELIRYFGAPEHHHIEPLDLRGQPAQRGDLGLDQVAAGADAAQRDVVDAGVLAVHRAEPVRDVQVDGSREPVGEVAAGHVVLAGLSGVEAQVFQHDQTAGAHSRNRGAGLGTDNFAGKVHLLAEQYAEMSRDRRQRVLQVRPATGTAEVSAYDHSGTAADQRGQGRQAGPDPAVIRDAVTVQRYVEVGAHQHPPPLDRDIIDRLHHHAISSSRHPAGRRLRARDASLVRLGPASQGRLARRGRTFALGAQRNAPGQPGPIRGRLDLDHDDAEALRGLDADERWPGWRAQQAESRAQHAEHLIRGLRRQGIACRQADRVVEVGDGGSTRRRTSAWVAMARTLCRLRPAAKIRCTTLLCRSAASRSRSCTTMSSPTCSCSRAVASCDRRMTASGADWTSEMTISAATIAATTHAHSHLRWNSAVQISGTRLTVTAGHARVPGGSARLAAATTATRANGLTRARRSGPNGEPPGAVSVAEDGMLVRADAGAATRGMAVPAEHHQVSARGTAGGYARDAPERPRGAAEAGRRVSRYGTGSRG
jgi:hypothetical protein